MINGQIPPYDSSVIHQQPFQRDPDSRAYIGTNVSPQPQNPSNLPQHNSKEVIPDIVLNLPVYKSSIKTDWFTRGNDNNWYYVRTDANGISQRKILFQVDIIQVTTIGQDNYGRFEHLVICYVNAGSSLLYTVIPFKKFMKKKLQDFFFLPAGFSIPNAKDNVINEFLFYLIMNCKNQRSVSSYPFQGWHIGSNEQLEFECTNRYEDVFKSYLPSSILKRSNTIPYPYGELYLDKISSVLPNEWEVKFIIALRISSLILKFTYMNQVNPKQLFIFESTENCNTTYYPHYSRQITNMILNFLV